MKKSQFVLFFLLSFMPFAQNKDKISFLLGTYTDSDSEGIYLYEADAEFIKFEKITSVFVKNPSYLAVSPDEKTFFAVSENGQEDSEILSFALDKKAGKITFISRQNTHGGAPCYVLYDADNKNVMTANYVGGNISVFPVKENGILGEISQNIGFSLHSHLHSVLASPKGKRIFATDLGADRLYSFRIVNNSLQRVENEDIIFEKGTGPRHFAFSNNGKYLYVLGELSREIIVFKHIKNQFIRLQTIETDRFKEGKGAADIHISNDGKFLYASNRLVNDGIAIFSIQKSGKLRKIGYQHTKKHPRNFAVSPDGKYMLVASRDENSVQVFEIQKDGLLQLKNELIVPKPVCILFLD
ncbi:MAG: lactonase family protein [Capnocytophaga sp.]|nr:lactonase family protein [Capnocytophaga sp.]